MCPVRRQAWAWPPRDPTMYARVPPGLARSFRLVHLQDEAWCHQFGAVMTGSVTRGGNVLIMALV